MRILAATAEPCDAERVDCVTPEPDASPGEQFNALLARVRTKYCTAVAGASQWHRRSAVSEMLEPIERGDYDLIMGATVACHRRWGLFASRKRCDEFGRFQQTDSRLALHSAEAAGRNELLPSDFGGEFFIARTDKLRGMGGWDGGLSLSDSIEFYHRAARYDLRVAAHPTASIWRWDVAPTGGPPVRPEAIARMDVAQLVDSRRAAA